MPDGGEYCTLACRWRRSVPRIPVPPSEQTRDAWIASAGQQHLLVDLGEGAGAMCSVCGGFITVADAPAADANQ